MTVPTKKETKMAKQNDTVALDVVVALVMAQETELKLTKNRATVKGFCLGVIATWLIVIAVCTIKTYLN
jgi:hypothetical protein